MCEMWIKRRLYSRSLCGMRCGVLALLLFCTTFIALQSANYSNSFFFPVRQTFQRLKHVITTWKMATTHTYEIRSTKNLTEPVQIPFEFLLTSTACENSKFDGRKPYIIAMILSNADHFKQREAVRQTWANKLYSNYTKLVHVFILGRNPAAVVVETATQLNSVSNSSVASYGERLLLESIMFDDIVLANFLDVYTNLTLKTLAGLYWIQQHCSSASSLLYVLKIDDDVLFNPFLLRRKLTSDSEILENGRQTKSELPQETSRFTKTFFCFVHAHAEPIRDPRNRWYVPKENYLSSRYPGNLQ